MLFDGDHSSLAQLALLNLDLPDAIGSLAEGAVVGAEFCKGINTRRLWR